MKNRKLEEKLNIYADSLERKNGVLDGAYREMDSKKYSEAAVRKERRAHRRRWGMGLAAAAVILITVVSIIITNLPDRPDNNTPAAPYSLSSLARKSVTQEEYSALAGAVVFTEEEGQSDGRFFTYERDDLLYAVQAIFKVIRDGNVDEITVIIDYMDALKDYNSMKPPDGNGITRSIDVKISGEYNSKIAKRIDGTVYYLIIASPSPGAGEYYENFL